MYSGCACGVQVQNQRKEHGPIVDVIQIVFESINGGTVHIKIEAGN